MVRLHPSGGASSIRACVCNDACSRACRPLFTLKPAYQPRGACEPRVPSGAARPRAGSSPGRAAAEAAGSPSSTVLRGVAPSRCCSAEGNSDLLLLRWSSSGSRYRQRCLLLRLLRSGRSGRSQTETVTGFLGGPWPESRWWVKRGDRLKLSG